MVFSKDIGDVLDVGETVVGFVPLPFDVASRLPLPGLMHRFDHCRPVNDPVRLDLEFSAKLMSEGRIAAARIFHATMPAKAEDAAMMTAAIDQAFGTTATELVVWTIGLI